MKAGILKSYYLLIQIISKPGYLTRTLENIFSYYSEIFFLSNPISLLAGDMPINGKQDGVINMGDLIVMAKSFGKIKADAAFDEISDLNKDDIINMADIVITAKSFGKTVSDYPEIHMPIPTETRNPMPTPTVTPWTSSSVTPTQTPTPNDMWVPCQLAKDQINVSVMKGQDGLLYGVVNMTFPDSGYRVFYYDDVVRYTDFNTGKVVDMANDTGPKVERWTGNDPTIMTKKTLVYKLPEETIIDNLDEEVFTFKYNLDDRISIRFDPDFEIPLLTYCNDPKEDWIQCQPSSDWINISVSKATGEFHSEGLYIVNVEYNFPNSGYRVIHPDYLYYAGAVASTQQDGTGRIVFKPLIEPTIIKWAGINDNVPTKIEVRYGITIKQGNSNTKYIFSVETGLDTVSQEFTPDIWSTPVNSSFKAKSVSAGHSTTVALQEDGTIKVWGHEGDGLCNVPKGIGPIKAVAAGERHIAALREDGTIALWGDNSAGQLNMPEVLKNITAISSGMLHTVALKKDGTVVSWGGNEEFYRLMPEGLNNVKAISAGAYHSLALKEDGTVAAWGNNYEGQCDVPAGLKNVKAIAAGAQHSIALKEDGTVVVWGGNGRRDILTIPEGLSNVKAIDAGEWFTIAVMEDGNVVAWGDNSLGKCEIPNGLNDINYIDIGINHTVVIKEDGLITVWGDNSYGQCNIPEAQN